jgi:hypothetical protein
MGLVEMLTQKQIRLRASGEADMGDLALYSHALGLLEAHDISTNLLPTSPQLTSTSTGANFPSVHPPSHPTWVFHESCGRTFLFSFLFLAIYTMLRDGGCSKGLFTASRTWTTSAPLWNAASEFDLGSRGRKRSSLLCKIWTSRRC